MAYSMEDLQKFSKDQFEQATSAATTLTKGIQEIAAEAADYSKKALEESTVAVEKLFGAKTLDSAIQIQSEYAKASYEGFVARATKFGEMYQNLAKEVYKPVEAAFAKMAPVAK